MKTFEQFVGQFPLKKCLGVGLEPTEETKNNGKLELLIKKDDKRNEDAKEVKKIIDRYHKWFIETCLRGLKLNVESEGKENSLEDYKDFISKDERKKADKVKANLRKQIAEAFKKGPNYKEMFKEELIKKHLVKMAMTTKEKKLIESFSGFTTYFDGFNENRENMYSGEEKSTAIAYRLINENLPIFYDNMQSFGKIAESKEGRKKYIKRFHSSGIFKLDYFTEVLTQDQIRQYNDIVGTCNKKVNIYNQKQENKRGHLPLLKKLKKMILSDKTDISWLPEKFGSDEEMVDAINKVINKLQTTILADNVEKSLKHLLLHIGEYDLSRIYITNDSGLNDISQKMFGWNDFFTNGKKNKSSKSFSISYLNGVSGGTETIEKYFASLGAYDRNGGLRKDIFTQIKDAREAAADILEGKHENLNKSDEDRKLIQGLLDTLKTLQWFVKPLLGNGDEADKDNEFYAELHEAWDSLGIITPLYDKVRNWLTRKPYSTEKIKLHFENNGTVLNGWVDNNTKSDKGTQYGGYLFRKKNCIGEYDYYLGISSNVRLFRTPCEDTECGEDNYERLNYYQLKSKTFYNYYYKGNYSEDKERMIAVIDKIITESTNEGLKRSVKEEKSKEKKESKISNPTGYLKFLEDKDAAVYKRLLENEDFLNENARLIDAIKEGLRSVDRISKAETLADKNYTFFTEIMEDVKIMCSEERIFEYFPISEKEMNDAVNRKKRALFLFKISNKDLSYADTFITGKRKSRGRDNLHTMYFKALMSGTQDVFDIGRGEVFFRAETKVLKTEPTHDANKPIRNKNKSTRERKGTSVFKYDLVKDKRYTKDSYHFHLSFTQNYKVSGTKNINPMVNEYLKTATDTHIIGIDRGERNLLYLVMIDMEGNIKKQFSLNEIKNEDQEIPVSTDYHDLLVERAKDNLNARRNWQTIESIKELKEGHLSQAIHKITELMVEYHAVVVLEDLNSDFIRSRQKREFQEYSKFEKMLANKLQYLVDKKKDADEIGGVLKGLQLTNCAESEKNSKSQSKFKHQNGFLFYVPAWKTSKIDPVTGFADMFNMRFKNVDETRRFFMKFDAIRYNVEKDWFEFVFDYNKFTNKAKDTKTEWTLCTYGERIKTLKKNNHWCNEEIALTDEFKKFFDDAGIDINGNLKEAICSLKGEHLEQLVRLMKLLLQMRNSETGTEVDYLLSPVADENGKFYDSREESRKNVSALPKDADANGAYNIARKGLWAIRKIQSTPDEKPNLAISNKEWLQFAQQKPYLDE